MKEIKNENVYMQALHRKLDVVLVQILRYNCSETGYSFCEDLPRSRTPPSTRMRVTPSDPFSPPLFFSLRRPCNIVDSNVLFHHFFKGCSIQDMIASKNILETTDKNVRG